MGVIRFILISGILGIAAGISGRAADGPAGNGPARENADANALAECERQTPACADLRALLHNLAARLRSEGRYAEARPLYVRALAVAARAYGESDPRIASSINGVALIQRDLREFPAAEQTAGRALSLLDSHGLGRTADAADSLLILGTALEGEGRHEEARKPFERAASIRVRLVGRSDSLTAEAWSNLAALNQSEGKSRRAEAYGRAALAALEKQDPRHERPAVLNNLARSLADQGRWKDAAKYYRQAIAAWETAVGPDHPSVAAGLTNLVAILVDHPAGPERAPETQALLERALDISRRHLAPGDPEIGRELAIFGRLHAARGENDAAAELYSRGIAILAAAWGAEDRRLLPWLDAYSKFLHAREDYAEAERIRLEATRIRVVNTLRNSH